MSIKANIKRIKAALSELKLTKSLLRTNLEGEGITVDEDADIDALVAAVSEIQSYDGSTDQDLWRVGIEGGRDEITELEVPDGVETIGAYAFYGCSSLESLTLPEGLTSVGKFAFSGCEKLKQVTIPESIAVLNIYAFRGCASLTKVTLQCNINVYPSFNATTGGHPFSGCSALTEVTLVKVNKADLTVTKFGYLFKGYPSEVVIHCADGDVSIIDGSIVEAETA